MASDTRRLRVIVTGDSTSANDALKSVGKSASNLNSVASFIGRWGARATAAFGAVGLAAAGMGIKTAMGLEQAETGFTSMLGSATKARKFITELQKFAAATPFEFPELVGAAQRFLAMGFAAEDIIPMLTAVGDAVSAMGGSAENVDAVTRALGQMQAKGKVSAEELLQLTEQGIPALQILADSYGVSTSQMSAMITRGQVLSSKAIPALIKGLEDGTKNVKGFGGMMEVQSQTIAGKWSTLMDNLKTGLGNTVREFEPQIKKAMDIVGKAFGDFFAGLQGKGAIEGFKGTLNNLGLGIRGMFSAFKNSDITGDGIVGVFEQIGLRARELADILVGLTKHVFDVIQWFDKHRGAALVLAGAILYLTAVTKIHARVLAVDAAGGLVSYIQKIGIVQSATKTWTAVQWSLNLAMSLNPISLIIIAVGLLVVAIVYAWQHSEKFRDVLIGVWNGIKDVAGAVASWFMSYVWPTLKAVFDGIASVAVGVADFFISAFNTVRDTIASTIAVISTVVSGIVSFFSSIWSGLVSAASAFVGWFSNNVLPPIKAVFDGIMWILSFFYNAVWKPIWILLQVAIAIFQVAFNGWVFLFSAALDFVRNGLLGWKLIFEFVFTAISGLVVSLWQNYIYPFFALIRDFINQIAQGFLIAWNTWIAPFFRMVADGAMLLWSWIRIAWDGIRIAIDIVTSWINSVVVSRVRDAFALLKVFGEDLWNRIRDIFIRIKDHIQSVLDAIVRGFGTAKDGIRAAWDQIQDIAKKPVNFIIVTVYDDGIRKLFNTIADKFGIKTKLDYIAPLAKGGVMPGYAPGQDTIPAMLSPGEGVLIPEVVKQLGISTILNWNRRGRMGARILSNYPIEQFADGGIVGWATDLLHKGKDIIQGIAGQAVTPLVNGLRKVLDGIPGGGTVWGSILKGAGNNLLDGLLSWVKGKDSEVMTAPGGGPMAGPLGGGSVMGWQNQMAVLRAVFPGLPLFSGFRPGSRVASGGYSYHAFGRAVDIPPRWDVFNWIAANYGANTRELIFSPAGARQIRNGHPYLYTGSVVPEHFNHVHWAMDNGGVIPPRSTVTVSNATSSREFALTEDKLQRLGGVHVERLEININGAGDPKKVAQEIRNELYRLGNRNGGSAGIP